MHPLQIAAPFLRKGRHFSLQKSLVDLQDGVRYRLTAQPHWNRQMPISPGLVSITFRKLPPERIAALAAATGLRAIEWGGDVHVPHGDLIAAKHVREITIDKGLAVSAYGSYYRAGGVPKNPPFQAVLDTALELAAPTIRVWAGTTGSVQADPMIRSKVIDDLRVICDQSAAHGLTISLEYHDNTLADHADAALSILNEVASPHLRCFWQPRHGDPTDAGLHDLSRLRPHLANLHVFHWWPDPATRMPLANGQDRWQRYLAAVNDATPRYASLEFVPRDDESLLAAEAATLLALLRHLA